jgi:uncharacterized repeat protein (TIGR01451 family)
VKLRTTLLSLATCIAFAGLVPAAFAQSDLAATKSGPSSAAKGSDVSFDVMVFNFGPNDAMTVSLSDPLPPGMTFVSANQNTGPAFDCSSQPAVGTNGTITCTLALFPNGSSADFTFVGHIPPATPDGTTFTNTATISSATTDPNPENNSGTTAVTVPIKQADIGVQKTGPSTAAPNTDVAYSITVNNAGPDPAVSFSLTDTLPGTMTFVSIAQPSGPAFDCSSHPAVGAGGTVTCTINPLAAGAVATFTLTGHIPSGTASGTTFSNTANVSSSTNDPNPDNNSSLFDLIVASSDLAITKTGPATANSGGTISWTITASNNGPDISQPTTFNDPLPAGTTFVSILQNTGPTFVCSDPGPGNNGSVSCSIGTIGQFASGASAQFTLTANIDPSFNGTLSNTATITGPNADTKPNNNSATASTTVTSTADLAINKTGPASANAGSNITYSLTLTNAGPSFAANVSLTDAVPANTTFVSESQTTGPTFSCVNPSVGGTGTITCTLASFANGGSATFSITVHISPGASGTVSNTANVSTTSTDPTPGNNSSTANTTVTQSADVSVVKAAAASAAAGSDLTYNITVTNNGPSNATTVAMNDTIPPNTTFVSESQPTGPPFICVNPPVGGTGTVSCSIATLTAGTSATFGIVVHFANATPVGPSSNTATVMSATTDPNAGNNSSTAVTTITPFPVPMVSPLALLLLGMVLAAAGALLLKR